MFTFPYPSMCFRYLPPLPPSTSAPPPCRNAVTPKPFSASPTPERLGEPPLPYPCPTCSMDLTAARPGDLAPRELASRRHQLYRSVGTGRGDHVHALGPHRLSCPVAVGRASRPQPGFGPARPGRSAMAMGQKPACTVHSFSHLSEFVCLI
jgi:hypothetical protein